MVLVDTHLHLVTEVIGNPHIYSAGAKIEHGIPFVIGHVADMMKALLVREMHGHFSLLDWLN